MRRGGRASPSRAVRQAPSPRHAAVRPAAAPARPTGATARDRSPADRRDPRRDAARSRVQVVAVSCTRRRSSRSTRKTCRWCALSSARSASTSERARPVAGACKAGIRCRPPTRSARRRAQTRPRGRGARRRPAQRAGSPPRARGDAAPRSVWHPGDTRGAGACLCASCDAGHADLRRTVCAGPQQSGGESRRNGLEGGGHPPLALGVRDPRHHGLRDSARPRVLRMPRRSWARISRAYWPATAGRRTAASCTPIIRRVWRICCDAVGCSKAIIRTARSRPSPAPAPAGARAA